MMSVFLELFPKISEVMSVSESKATREVQSKFINNSTIFSTYLFNSDYKPVDNSDTDLI